MKYFVGLVLSLGVLCSLSCSTPRVIRIDPVGLVNPINLIDDRPEKEKHRNSKCPHRSGTGVSDESFNPPRMDVLLDRLSQFLPAGTTVTVKRFQVCTRLKPSAAAMSGLSYPVAIALDAEYSKQHDIVTTILDLEIDGLSYSSQSIYAFDAGFVMASALEKESTIQAIELSIEDAISRAAMQYRDNQNIDF